MTVRTAWLLVALSVILTSGCGRDHAVGTAKRGPNERVIAVIPKGTTHVYWQAVRRGAEAAGRELGYQIRWNGPERETDRERQIQIVEDFMAQRVAGVVLAPLDQAALVPAVNLLQELKIPCVIIDSGIATEQRLSFIATDNFRAGAMAARRMGAVLGGQGNVLLLRYVQGSDSTTARENGFTATLAAEYPRIGIVDSKYAQDTVETALQATEDLLTRNRNVQGLFASNASASVGAFQALQAHGRADITLIGFDPEKRLLDGLRAGRVDSIVVQDPYQMGYQGVKTIALYLRGEAVPAAVDTGVTLVTRESLRDSAVASLLASQ
ncbi:MAG: substrate-binding domain-containing protein [Proteobacteria bacterium]|nr:substrate-binding domain-containing protein [Pseudomonadota bacterium]